MRVIDRYVRNEIARIAPFRFPSPSHFFPSLIVPRIIRKDIRKLAN